MLGSGREIQYEGIYASNFDFCGSVVNDHALTITSTY